MTAKMLTGFVTLALLLASADVRGDCADVFGCICGVNDVVIVATVLEVREDGYMSVELERIEETSPGAGNAWQVGEVLDALPDMHVKVGARAYLTAIGKGATDMLVQLNQAQPDGSVVCLGVSFEQEEFLATALASDCHDRAQARGIDSHCVDEVHCAASRARPQAPSGWWLVGLALATLGLRRNGH